MEGELARIRKYNRRVFIALFLLTLLVVAGIVITATEKKSPVVQNYIGQQGRSGNDGHSIEGPQGPTGYTPVKGIDYFDGKDSTIPGPQGSTGPVSIVPGPVGPAGESIQGPPGDNGQDGKNPEFRCHNSNYQWNYVGDEDWITLQKNSLACQSPL